MKVIENELAIVWNDPKYKHLKMMKYIIPEDGYPYTTYNNKVTSIQFWKHAERIEGIDSNKLLNSMIDFLSDKEEYSKYLRQDLSKRSRLNYI